MPMWFFSSLSSWQAMTESHTWHISNHARPTFCNVCRESLSGESVGIKCQGFMSWELIHCIDRFNSQVWLGFVPRLKVTASSYPCGSHRHCLHLRATKSLSFHQLGVGVPVKLALVQAQVVGDVAHGGAGTSDQDVSDTLAMGSDILYLWVRTRCQRYVVGGILHMLHMDEGAHKGWVN